MLGRSLLLIALAFVLRPANAQLRPLREHLGTFAFQFVGFDVEGVGDMNGDGIPDYALGISGEDINGLESGRVALHSGADGSLLWSVDGPAVGVQFGFSLAQLGDVDQDGVGDLVVGAPYASNGGSLCGSAYVLSGTDGQILRSFFGDSAGDLLGTSVAGVGDVSGDGVPDILIGVQGSDVGGVDAGLARLCSGIDGTIIRDIVGPGPGAAFAKKVSGIADVSGDAVPDLVVGASGDDGGGTNAGSVSVFSGGQGTLIHRIEGLLPGDRLGASVAGLHDLDGDGVPEFAAGAPEADPNGPNSGQAFVFSGLTGAVLHSWNGPGATARFGDSLSPGGDLDGDGVQDLLIGAWADSRNNFQDGSFQVLAGVDGSVLATFEGVAADWGYGYALSDLGDINGDGLDDILVGSPYNTAIAYHAGRVLIETLCGAHPYGAGLGGSNTLTLDWEPGPAGAVATGIARGAGATPGGYGIIAVSLTQDSIPYLGGTILVDPFSSAFGTFLFNAQGEAPIPLGLRVPSLAGVVIYAQMSDYFAGKFSNGLEVLFSN